MSNFALGSGDVLKAPEALDEKSPRSCVDISVPPIEVKGVTYRPSGESSLSITAIPATSDIVFAMLHTPYPEDNRWGTKLDLPMAMMLQIGSQYIRSLATGSFVQSSLSQTLGQRNPNVDFRIKITVDVADSVTKEAIIDAFESMKDGYRTDDDRTYLLHGDSPFVPSVDLFRKGFKLGSLQLISVKGCEKEILT